MRRPVASETYLPVIWVAQSVFLDKIYMNIKKKTLHSVSEALQATSEETLPDKITELGKENNLCLAVYKVAEGGGVTFIGSCDAKPACNCMLHQLQLRQVFPRSGAGVQAIKEKTVALFAARTAENGGFCFLNVEEASTALNARVTDNGLPPESGSAPARGDTSENLTAIVRKPARARRSSISSIPRSSRSHRRSKRSTR